jgi:hypothetical protein
MGVCGICHMFSRAADDTIRPRKFERPDIFCAKLRVLS